MQVNSSTGKLAMYVLRSGIGDLNYDGTGATTLSTGTWYYISLVYSEALTTGALIGYVNASVDKSVNAGGTATLNSTASSTYIGNDPVNASRFWNGVIDEVRVCSIARSANWITTEYNNEVAPGTFETLGTEVSVGGGASTGNMFLVM